MRTLSEPTLRRYRNQVAMVFQDPRAHVNPVRRIGDFMTEALRTNLGVSLGARPRAGVGHARARSASTTAARRLRQYPHELSGGMLQRVMIAAALLTEPRLLLADEPTTALDVTTQAEVMAILDGLRREFGLAMLFITHDLELAAAICDRTAVMYAGQIVEVRDAGELHDDPLHPYTAALAAARPDIEPHGRSGCAIPGRPLSAFEARPMDARSRRAARTPGTSAGRACRPVDRARRRAVAVPCARGSCAATLAGTGQMPDGDRERTCSR